MTRLRVAMVGPYPVGRGLTNGVEAVTVEMVNLLRVRPDIELHVITTVFGGSSDTIHEDDLTIHTVGSDERLRRITFYRRERSGIAATIKAIAPDVVHVQGANFYAMGALDADVPTVVTLHGMLFREANIVDPRSSRVRQIKSRIQGHFNARFEAKVLAQATEIVTISQYVNECIAGRTSARLHAIPNPIDDAFFDIVPTPDPGRILFLGRIEPRKGQHVLIDAAADLASKGIAFELRLVGKEVDADYAAAAKQQVERLGLGQQVNFVGVVSDEEVLDEYSKASLLMMASREETSPMVIQQAMAAGVPSVAPAVAGIPYLVDDGVDGLVVPTTDMAQGLASGAAELLRDNQRRQALGRAGQVKAANFRAGAVGDQTVAVYREVLGVGTEEVNAT